MNTFPKTQIISWFMLFVIGLTLLMSRRLPVSARESVGIASFYSEQHRGRRTASGQRFNPDKLTCASWHYPMRTRLRITNLDNGRSVIVVVNDRGPAHRLKRAIDLSRAAFQKIAALDIGLIRVKIETI